MNDDKIFIFFLDSFVAAKSYAQTQSGLESSSDEKNQQASKMYKRQHPVAGLGLIDLSGMIKVNSR